MNKGIKTIMGKPTETADRSYWEFTVSGLGNLYRTELGPLNVDDSYVVWAACVATNCKGERKYTS